MDSLHHRKTPDDCRQELSVRITNSFPPKGIVAQVLNNAPKMKAGSLYQHGNCNLPPSAHQNSCQLPSKAQHIDLKLQKSSLANGFSPPPTVTEIKSLTRKIPRFYTVDSSVLRHGNVKILPTMDKLIANAELIGIKEVYQRVCKGDITSLKSLMSGGKISQKFALIQTCAPLRYYQKHNRHLVAATEQRKATDPDGTEMRCRMEIKSTSKKRVLLPSPYFYGAVNSSRNSTECYAPHIFYAKTKDSRQSESEDKKPIEPTVINLNNKLPELPDNERLQARFQTKSIIGVKKQGGGGTLAVFADTTATPLSTSQTEKKRKESSEDLPQVKNKHILYGKNLDKK